MYIALLQNDSLVFASSGLNSNQKFSCPKCKQKVFLKRGKERKPHFSHYDGSGAHSPETELHYVAKYIFHELNEIEYVKGKMFHWDQCVIEEEMENGKRADVYLTNSHTKQVLVVEIVVHHKTEQEKLDDYRRMGLNCLEIDLKYLLNAPLNIGKIQHEITHNLKNKTFHDKYMKLYEYLFWVGLCLVGLGLAQMMIGTRR